MNIGVLALQGSVAEHLKLITSVNKKIGAVPVRTIDELATVDGLIIPGGESTTLRKLMDDFNLYTPIRERIVAGMPVWGTCAGLILLADRIEGERPYFALLDVDVKRNAYGRQACRRGRFCRHVHKHGFHSRAYDNARRRRRGRPCRA